MKAYLLWLMAAVVGMSSCSEIKGVYLGKGADTAFSTSHIITRKHLELTYVDFLNYKTFRYQAISLGKGEDTYQSGVIGRYSSTLQQDWACEVAFGSPGDTCSVIYFSTLETRYNASAAVVPGYNIFSNSRIDPYAYNFARSLHVNGVLRNSTDSASFYFKKIPQSLEAVGTLNINENTMYLLPLNNAIDRRGNVIDKPMGMQLRQNGKIIAAIDTYHKKGKIYISSSESPSYRLLIASYLSLVISHQKFTDLSLYGY